METRYTLNLLVQYLYGETPILKKLEIENAIENDSTLKREFQKLKSGFNLLPKVKFYPKENTTNAIMNYSQKGALNPSF